MILHLPSEYICKYKENRFRPELYKESDFFTKGGWGKPLIPLLNPPLLKWRDIHEVG